MTTGDEGSVSRWIVDLKAGDHEAARQLWDRYFGELVRLARQKLRASARAAADEEDVAISAFFSLCAGARRGRFAGLDDRNELWRLLATITVRKAFDQVLNQRRQKRGGSRVIGESALGDRGQGNGAAGLDGFLGKDPTPEFFAILSEQTLGLVAALPDESLRRVARLRLEGYTGEEIAGMLGCNRRTVTRKLELIRATWSGSWSP